MYNCENDVSSWKIAVLKKAYSGEVALAKTYNYFEKSTGI